MTVRLIAAVAMVAAVAAPVRADARATTLETVQDLFDLCGSSDQDFAIICELLVEGIAGAPTRSGAVACPPKFGGEPATPAELAEPERAQFRRVQVVQPVLSWLKAHPQPSDTNWLAGVETAALDLWPCEASRAPGA